MRSSLEKFKLLLLAVFISCSTASKLNFSYRGLSSDCAQYTRGIFHRLDLGFSERREALFRNLKKLEDEDRFSLVNAIESFHYIDFDHAVSELDQIRRGELLLKDATFPFRYNIGGPSRVNSGKKFLFFFNRKKNVKGYEELLHALEKYGEYNPPQYKEKALENFLNTRNWLIKNKPNFSLESFKKTHELMMKGGIEYITAQQLGEFREVSLIGNVYRKPISDIEYKNITQSKYLDFKVKSVNEIAGKGKQYKGEIVYPSVGNIKDELLTELKTIDKKLHDEIIEFKKNKTGSRSVLTRRLVNALTEERLNWFVRERDQIGSINTAEKFDQYINLITQLQRDIVSIHPFRNGNGRTTREFLINYALIREDIFPSRISDTDLDLYSPFDDWKEVIVQGIESSEKLYRDFDSRLELGLNFGDSPELFLPHIPREAPINLKKFNSIKVKENSRFAETEARQFLIFYDYYLEEKGPDFIKKLENNTQSALKELEREYASFFKKNKIDYIHSKEGLQEVNLHFVDRDFSTIFGKNTFSNANVWKAKMDQWYYDKVIWRGLSYKRIFPEEEIISMFTDFHQLLYSNSLLKQVGNTREVKQVKNAALKDFKLYNDELYKGGLVQLAKDHSETGPRYRNSYGYSTSKNRTVAKAFSMGAMVIAEYGKHNTPELQKLLKGRILAGFKRSKKDVDLGRLKQLREEFSYSYGRQQEVMGIGAAEPDSVMIIQTIDEEGKVIKSYVRDEKDPAMIYVFSGNIQKVSSDNQSKLIKKVKLETISEAKGK